MDWSGVARVVAVFVVVAVCPSVPAAILARVWLDSVEDGRRFRERMRGE